MHITLIVNSQQSTTTPFDLLTKGNNGMKYLLLIYLEENALSETEREDCYVKSAQLAQQLNSNGQYLATAPLHPVATATSVRVRDGKPLVTDGPFAETREQLGGFFLINAQDLDGAIAIAARIPAVQVGTVEIRPVIEVAGLPEH
ncbi:YciI family protein [Komarekiella delphini-convector]|nr:YciI family protein [Komarekiella delphini-convector]